MACASENCSRYHGSIMAVSRGRPHMFTLYQRGRGHEPVTVAGRIRSLVAVNAMSVSFQTVELARSRLAAPALYRILCRKRTVYLAGDHPPRLQHKPWIGPRAVPARSAQKQTRALGASERPGAVGTAASRDGSRSEFVDDAGQYEAPACNARLASSTNSD